MKKALVIGHKFTDQSSQRIEKFLKYLPNYNWNPLVLTSWDPLLPIKGKKSRIDRIKVIRSIEIPLWIIPANLVIIFIMRKFRTTG